MAGAVSEVVTGAVSGAVSGVRSGVMSGVTWSKSFPQRFLIVTDKGMFLPEFKVSRNWTLDSFAHGLKKYMPYFGRHDTTEQEPWLRIPAVGDIPIVSLILPPTHPLMEDTQSPTEAIPSEIFFKKKQDSEKFESICVVALTTVAHMQESVEELEAYVQKVFDLPAERYETLHDKAKQTQCPNLILVCRVISAEGLISKDANGKSDPYCKLAILSRRHQDFPHVRQKDMTDWQKTNLIKDIVQTTVQPETLEPVWNEKMELYVCPCASHTLSSFPGCKKRVT